MIHSFARKTGPTAQTFVMMTFILELLLLVLLSKSYFLLVVSFFFIFELYRTNSHPKK